MTSQQHHAHTPHPCCRFSPDRGAARTEIRPESFRRGATDAAHLQRQAATLRARYWQLQADAGLDFVRVGDVGIIDGRNIIDSGNISRTDLDAALATHAFRISTGVAHTSTLIYTHMGYAECKEIQAQNALD